MVNPNIEIVEDGVPISPDEISASRAANLNWLMHAAEVGKLTKIEKLLAGGNFSGVEDPRFVNVTNDIESLTFEPKLALTFIVNDGPNPVRVGINQQAKWRELQRGESRSLDHRNAGRIGSIYYYCPTQNATSSLRVEGVY